MSRKRLWRRSSSDLRYISAASPLHLRYISATSPLYLPPFAAQARRCRSCRLPSQRAPVPKSPAHASPAPRRRRRCAPPPRRQSPSPRAPRSAAAAPCAPRKRSEPKLSPATSCDLRGISRLARQARAASSPARARAVSRGRPHHLGRSRVTSGDLVCDASRTRLPPPPPPPPLLPPPPPPPPRPLLPLPPTLPPLLPPLLPLLCRWGADPVPPTGRPSWRSSRC